MIEIRQANTPTGEKVTLRLKSEQSCVLEAQQLILLPGLIDPHVHFRTPGLTHKEDWHSAAEASLQGGYTQVFDMPNTLPPTTTLEALQAKQALIDQQLQACKIPLHYRLFLGADKHRLKEMIRVKQAGFPIAGIKIFMGCSTGGLLIQDPEDLASLFRIAAEQDLLVAVHAESESIIQQNRQRFPLPQPYATHSKVRDVAAAVQAVKEAIALVRRYKTRLYLVHISTAAEIDMIAQAKAEGLPVFAEVAPHHLFLTEANYETLQGKAIMNPPLRTQIDQAALWKAIQTGIIDTVGSDHAPHLLQEKTKPYGDCPAGVPGIETSLALLMNAYHQGLLSLERIAELTSKRAQAIFRLEDSEDYTLVDPQLSRSVKSANLKTKCGWSPFEGRILKGWPVQVILRRRVYPLN
jgi:dihydroorotase